MTTQKRLRDDFPVRRGGYRRGKWPRLSESEVKEACLSLELHSHCLKWPRLCPVKGMLLLIVTVYLLFVNVCILFYYYILIESDG